MEHSIPPAQMSESFRIGALLALAGGFFDVYTYLCRGGVFANAQTGNMVLLGIALAGGDWQHALHYVFPIAAFALGVAVAEWIKLRYKTRSIRMHWRQIVILTEILLVMVVAFLPQDLNTLVNTVVSFICALQVESFRKVHGSPFATTMCTGNLRSATEQFIHWRTDGDFESLIKSRRYAAIIAYFIIGAALGAVCAGRFGDRAVLVTLLALLSVFILMFRERTA